MKHLLKSAVLAAALCSTAMAAFAQDLTIGRSSEQSSIDPQFSRTGNNQGTSEMIFDRLVEIDQNLQITPGIVTEWTNIDPTTWELKLREGVTFHDGSPLTADDVIYSLERADEVPNSPAPYSDMVAAVDKLEKVDDLTVRVTTKGPQPALIKDIGRVFVVSKVATEGKSSNDFNSGDAAIGTGPYSFVEWTPGQNLRVKAYDGYWGDAPEFKDIDIKFISNDAARVAALLSGAVDVIDAVPPTDVETVTNSAGFKVESAPSGRVVYLALSMAGETVPDVTDLQGNPLDKNPFNDARVRKAVSLMIDRQLIVDRILRGSGIPAGQLVPEVLGGYAYELGPDAPDPEQAKALLAEAGYPGRCRSEAGAWSDADPWRAEGERR